MSAERAAVDRLTHAGHELAEAVRRRMKRRMWVGNGRAHIEVRGVHQPGEDAFARAVESALAALRGVDLAEVNGALGRVVVSFDGAEVQPAELVDAVAALEETFGRQSEAFPSDRPDHPGDAEPLRHQLIALGADLVGAGASTLRQMVGLTAVPPEVAPLVSLLENTPRLRHVLDDRLGPPAADLVLGITGAAAQALSQGPFGPLVDAARRVGLAAETASTRQVWRRRESELYGRHRRGSIPAIARETRPRPLPPGSVERYADTAGIVSLAGSALALAVSGNHQRAATVLADGSPKAALAAREAFAAWLGVGLTRRGVVPLESQALRRLDRLDTVVVDASALAGSTYEIVAVTGPDGGPFSRPRERALTARARALLDPIDPTCERADKGWRLAGLARIAGAGRGSSVRGRGPARRLRLGLAYGDRLAAVVEVASAPDPLTADVLAAARRVGEVVMTGDPALAARYGVERFLPGGARLAAAIRRLQRDGRAVGLVAGRGDAALRGADCGIGVLYERGPVPWGAHLLCGPGLDQVIRILDAASAARTLSRRGDLIAAWGAGAGALLALAGPGRGATTRALRAVNTATAVAVTTGAWTSAELARRPDLERPDPRSWHAMDTDATISALATSPEGLDRAEAQARLARRPADPRENGAGLVRATAEELVNPLTPVLALGAGVAAAAGSVTDAVIIGSVAAANAALGAVQRVGSSRALRRLLRASATRARVVREHEQTEIDADEVVPGDVVVLAPGDAVVGDCRLLEADDLEVDESSLTGESQLVAKQVRPVAADYIADRSSMLYEGTVVRAGHARAVAVATGPHTEAARGLTVVHNGEASRAGNRLGRLTRATVPAAVGAGAALVGAGLARGRGLREAVSAGAGLAVAAIPEGLPLVATVAQLAGARRLAGDGVLVRTASTMEALGRVDVLCFDKTGTLTAGDVALRRVSDGQTDVAVADADASARRVLAAGLRASPAALAGHELPHPTDRAVVAAAESIALPADEGRPGWRLLDEVPFDSERGYHAALGATDGGRVLSVKGAPEVVLPLCTGWRRDSRSVPLDALSRRLVDKEIDRLAAQGYRLLAVAERTASGDAEINHGRMADLDVLGLLAFADPVRPTSRSAVTGLRESGVRVVMATGDHPSTARSIAEEVGIDNADAILTGADVDLMTEGDLGEVLPDISVFARVSPSHKVRIVGALQQAGHVVAMTGDGANDAAAIRLADVGVALGERGTDAAREAADLVIVDGGIESILGAIVEGRASWASVRDAVSVLVGGNLGEIAFTLGAGLVSRQGSPLNARQLLLVNLFTDVLPSMALAVGARRWQHPAQLLNEGPDRSLGAALTRDVTTRATATTASAVGAFTFARLTGGRAHASTVALGALIGAQLGQTVLAGWRSPLVLGASAVSAAGLVSVIQTPVVSQFFGCRPIGPLGWATVLSASGLATAGSLLLPPVTARVSRLMPTMD